MFLDEIIKIGIENSIPSHVMYSRVCVLQWGIERAISVQVSNKDRLPITLNKQVYKEHIDIAREYSISFSKYMKRLNQGWHLKDIIRAGNSDKVVYNGTSYTCLTDLANKLWLNPSLLYTRVLTLGWSLVSAVETLSSEAPYEYKGKFYSLAGLVKLSNNCRGTVLSRLRRNWSVQKIVETPTLIDRRKEKSTIYNGRSYTVTDLVGLTGFSRRVINSRLNSGWDVKRIINTKPVRAMKKKDEGVKYQYNGSDCTLSDLVEISGIKRQLLASRLSRGWSVERAVTTPVLSPKERAQLPTFSLRK